MADHSRKSAKSLALAGVFVIALMACLSWSFHTNNIVAGSFRLDEVQICEELDEDLKPVRADRNIPLDAQQVCLWFAYSRARNGDSLEISWSLNERMIQRETVRLSERSGTRAFYLLKEDGSPLDAGYYSVSINCNGRERGTESFSVASAAKDVSADVLIWD
ncbi:MAG: hypothetical protein LBQ36_06285 [Synergistaceae bacterium]|jgi:hypothetical protein|nr:hypothetical protein [Synergistaceae bacterium]